MKGDTRQFTRRLIIQEQYFDKEFNNRSLVRKPSTKFISTTNNELNGIVNKLHKIDPMAIRTDSNLSNDETTGYSQLKALSRSTIEIKKADKSDTWVIMNKDDYRDLIMKEHLLTSTYENAALNSNEKVFIKLKKLIDRYDACLTKDEIRHICDESWNNAYFYGLPKLHKCEEVTDRIKEESSEYIKMDLPSTLKTRPICGGPSAVTQGASRLLNEILSPLVPQMRSYIKDEWDFVRRFPRKVKYNATLLSCDIVSLYPSIPIELGLEALNYWIDKLRDKIQGRFTKEFILELTKFVLENNICEFDSQMFRQIMGTAMGTVFAPPYACLVIGYLEETKLFPVLLPAHFDPETVQNIIDHFYRFMDDGTTLFPANVDQDLFLKLLNSMHPAIRYTVAQPERLTIAGKRLQRLVFLSLILYLDEDGNIWTDVHYKQTNTHEYLNFSSHHPDHVKKNIPFVLAKRIVVFTTKETAMQRNLADLRLWLHNCGYPETIINKGIHNALLQGPAPPKDETRVIPLISTYYDNYNNRTVLETAKSLLKNTQNDRLKSAFQNVDLICAFKQPPSLLRSLSHSKFGDTVIEDRIGVFHCKDSRCKQCKLYLQVGNQVTFANGVIWDVKCFADCNSLNVLYYLICNFCLVETYIGKTDDGRERTNNHITGCRHGSTKNIFDKHVYACASKKGMELVEPFFKYHILMVCSSYHKLLAYESALHAKGLDTLNNPNN